MPRKQQKKRRKQQPTPKPINPPRFSPSKDAPEPRYRVQRGPSSWDVYDRSLGLIQRSHSNLKDARIMCALMNKEHEAAIRTCELPDAQAEQVLSAARLPVTGSVQVLDARDWEEIYYSVDTKMHAIMQGKYGPEDEDGQDAEWIAHLRDILAKIGPDGRDALARQPVIDAQWKEVAPHPAECPNYRALKHAADALQTVIDCADFPGLAEFTKISANAVRYAREILTQTEATIREHDARIKKYQDAHGFEPEAERERRTR